MDWWRIVEIGGLLILWLYILESIGERVSIFMRVTGLLGYAQHVRWGCWIPVKVRVCRMVAEKIQVPVCSIVAA